MMASSWITLQLGAREHYAIARALHSRGLLELLITDFWLPPGAPLAAARRLGDRWHPALRDALVQAPNRRSLLAEARFALGGQRAGWGGIVARNQLFQRYATRVLRRRSRRSCASGTLFSYSYTARLPFLEARRLGLRTVLGQIDPGPEEERLVAAERRRYPHLATVWEPAPAAYWQQWQEELELADRVLINSSWSRRCLLQAGVPEHKLVTLPLVFDAPPAHRPARSRLRQAGEPFQLLFLGTIGLRKGVARLLEAMRLLEGTPIQLTLAGPTQIDPVAWADRPNIRWIGAVPRSGVAQLYAAADAFVLPTLSDGFALTQLEALAHGCPVIASTCCGDVVQPGLNGWLLPSLEPVDLAGSLRDACDAVAGLPRPLQQPSFTMEDLAAALPQLAEQR
jgi:glycosyltransferase involved in cell wall biosynthesis